MTGGNLMLNKSELWIEYLALKKENKRLKEIIKESNILKSNPNTDNVHQVDLDIINSQKIKNQSETNNKIIDKVIFTNDINQSSPTVDKIQLFMSLFHGRNDVMPKGGRIRTVNRVIVLYVKIYGLQEFAINQK